MSEPLLVDIGWRNCSAQAALAYFPPEPIGKAERELAKHLFPADGPANDLAHRIVQVRCPYDLTIRISPLGSGRHDTSGCRRKAACPRRDLKDWSRRSRRRRGAINRPPQLRSR
jgi:hypothetical protein